MRAWTLGLVLAALLAAAAQVRAEEPPAPLAGECAALATRLADHDRAIHQELRQLKRELAGLKQNRERPGVRDIAAGIGYILGLFGVAAFMAARRRPADKEQ